MKKKVLAMLMTAAMVMGMTVTAFAGETESEVTPAEMAPVETKVALITMDQMDVHWVRLQEAAQARVDELNEAGSKIEMTWLAPETKDNAQLMA